MAEDKDKNSKEAKPSPQKPYSSWKEPANILGIVSVIGFFVTVALTVWSTKATTDDVDRARTILRGVSIVVVGGLVAVVLYLCGLVNSFRKDLRKSETENAARFLEVKDAECKLDDIQRDLATKQSELTKAASEHALALSKAETEHKAAVDQVHGRYETIANHFNNLSEELCKFHAAVVKHSLTLAAATRSVNPSQRQRRPVKISIDAAAFEDEFIDALEAICKAGANVLEEYREPAKRVPCSANIKLLKQLDPSFGMSGAGYFVAVRPEEGDSELIKKRLAHDARTQTRNVPVVWNYMYDQILTPGKPNHYLCPDVKALVKRLNADKRMQHYREPEASADHYDSCLVVPLLGQDPIVESSGIGDNYDHLAKTEVYVASPDGDGAILGFFCIDCGAIGHFNDQYDLKIMRQLANYVFDCARAYYAVLKMNNSLKSPDRAPSQGQHARHK